MAQMTEMTSRGASGILKSDCFGRLRAGVLLLPTVEKRSVDPNQKKFGVQAVHFCSVQEDGEDS